MPSGMYTWTTSHLSRFVINVQFMEGVSRVEWNNLYIFRHAGLSRVGWIEAFLFTSGLAQEFFAATIC